jgi:hypothetical protein
MFLLRKWLSLQYPRTLIFGLLVVAMLACSFPITHADHTNLNHGHYHHDDAVSDMSEGDFAEKKTSQDERSSHQHFGMNEHNPGFLSFALEGFSLNASVERWQPMSLQQPRQDFLYELERPPRFDDLA